MQDLLHQQYAGLQGVGFRLYGSVYAGLTWALDVIPFLGSNCLVDVH